VADYYVKRGKFLEAKSIVERMVAKYPSNQIGRQLLDFINRALQS
jgi:outer membrane protein assembly factor BamD (BamD/ComL family)